LADRVISVAELLVTEVGFAFGSALVVLANAVTTWNVRASLATAFSFSSRASRAFSEEAIVASERAATSYADTGSVIDRGRALTVERASRSNDLSSASGTIKLSLTQAHEGADTVSTA